MGSLVLSIQRNVINLELKGAWQEDGAWKLRD